MRGSSRKAAAPPESTADDTTTDFPVSANPALTDPSADRTPVTRAELGKLVQAHLRAATRPGSSTEITLEKPTQSAALAASSAVAKRHLDSVVAQAEQWQSWDEDAGGLVRRLWYDRGFRGYFENPGAMVDALAVFWWENRDLLPALQEQLEAAGREIDRLRRERDPEVRRREEVDKVWAMALTAAVAGRPLSRANFAYYIEVAEAIATHSPIPDPPSSDPVVPSREGP